VDVVTSHRRKLLEIQHWMKDHIGFNRPSSLLRIEANHCGVDLEFPGWVSVGDVGSTLVRVQADLYKHRVLRRVLCWQLVEETLTIENPIMLG
jgi:hypothetical protein